MTASAKIPFALIIDDDSVDQMLYKRIIDRSGLIETVLSFHYAEEALTYLRQPDRPDVDVIFLDINMPGLTGFEFLEIANAEFGSSLAEIVVIMLTTSLDPKDRAKADAYDCVKAYFDKPLTNEHLQEISVMLSKSF